VQACEQALLALGSESLAAYFEGGAPPSFLADEGRLILFGTVVQLALVELWRAYGVEPGAVLGISSGEPAALYAAGGLTLTDALRVGLSWARISQVEPPAYGTLLLNTDYARARELCAGCPVPLFVIIDVDPTRQTLFCPLADIEAGKAYLRAQGATFYQIKTAPIWPYHTPVLIQHAAVLGQPLQGIVPRPTTKPCYLATFGRMLPAGTLLAGDYWLRPPQEPVFQYDTVQAALRDGYFVMTPLGPYPFAYSGRDAHARTLGRVRFTTSFAADKPELATFADMRRALQNLGLAPTGSGGTGH
jgi:myxalamid-type polyketide synthase MxaE and MxaD